MKNILPSQTTSLITSTALFKKTDEESVENIVETLTLKICIEDDHTTCKERKNLVNMMPFTTVPYIGKYLATLDVKTPLIKEFYEEIKTEWINILCDIVKKHKINMKQIVIAFDQWVIWAKNYNSF